MTHDFVLHLSEVISFMLQEHTDGAGPRMKSVLEAIAIAWRNQLPRERRGQGQAIGKAMGKLWKVTMESTINIH